MKAGQVTSIECPNCGNKEEIEMPDYVCVRVFKCSSCQEVVHPKEGDCCVFCSYAEDKCPAKQHGKDRNDDELNLEV
ncbi:MAG: GDCCVxC domain-containing (seleno)protein [Candidatus Heimdallarchaeaceae archaeon]